MIKRKLSKDATDDFLKAALLLCEAEIAANKADSKNKLDDKCKDDSVSLAAKHVALLTSSPTLSETKQKILAEEDRFSKMTSLTPFNIQVSVTETKDPIKFLKFVSEVVTASKDDVKKTLKDNIKIDADKEKTEKEKADGEAANLENIYKAEIAVQTAITVKNKLTNPTPEDLAIADYNIKIAKLKANSAYRAANEPEPYKL